MYGIVTSYQIVIRASRGYPGDTINQLIIRQQPGLCPYMSK